MRSGIFIITLWNEKLQDTCIIFNKCPPPQGFLDIKTSLVAQLVKNPPAMQEIPVRFLGWEDLLEKT